MLQAKGMTTDLHLAPGIDLQVQRLALNSGPWQIDGAAGQVAQAQALTVSMVQTDQPETYQFDVVAPEFSPGEFARRSAGSDAALPDSFQSLQLDMRRNWPTVSLAPPLSLSMTRPEIMRSSFRPARRR